MMILGSVLFAVLTYITINTSCYIIDYIVEHSTSNTRTGISFVLLFVITTVSIFSFSMAVVLLLHGLGAIQ